MAGYTIGDRKVAETIVEAGKKKPWNPKTNSATLTAPAGNFLSAYVGIVANTISARTESGGEIYPAQGTVTITRQAGDDGALETKQEIACWNFSDSEFDAGDVVCVLTDNFHRPYILAAQGGGESDPCVLCKITGGSSAAGYAAKKYANGAGANDTGSTTIYVTELALGPELPADSWVIGHPALAKRTGGNDT
jgi:hypothetical protein